MFKQQHIAHSAADSALSRRRAARDARSAAGRIAIYAILVVVGLISIVPFAWMISTSLKSEGEVFAWPPTLIPSPIEWGNYGAVLAAMPFARYFLNTLIYTTAVTVGQLVCCSLAGFAFARLKFPGRDALFVLYLGTLMIPATVTIVPSFMLMRWFNWVNTPWAMTIPGMFGSAFGTFLMRQFFLTIPSELDDAATIDGAGKFRVFWQINLPLTTSALAVLAVFTITTVWNDFLWPLIMLRDDEVKTLTLGLASFRGGTQSYTYWSQLMAAATMSVAPLIAVFVVAQRYFVEGIALTGSTGR
jgi:multiple sugar transport system permease protein